MLRTAPTNIRKRFSASLHVPEWLRHRLGWTTTSYVSVQIVRFGTNLILTRILAPDLFGIMMLVTSIRVGLELFTDIGVGQNIIANREANDPKFYNTAWSLQILRGLLLAGVALALMSPLSQIYPQKTLQDVLPVICVLFVLTGTHSVGLALAAKALDTKRIAQYEIGSAIVGSTLSIVIAMLFPTIWGLVAGNVAATLVASIASYLVRPDLRLRFMIDRSYAKQMIGFGKWVFLSSVVFFFATNFDRLVLAKYVSLTMLGIYGIARSLSDILAQFALALGNTIIFPAVAMTELRGKALQKKLSVRRLQLLTAALLATAGFIALSDLIVAILYDARYAAAAQVLPWVGLAVWIGILNTLNDSVMLGLSKPHYAAIGNVAKFGTMLALLPLGIVRFGIVGAAGVMAIAELSRYAVLTVGQTKEGMRFTRQDLASTAAMLTLALVIRSLAFEVGLAGPHVTIFAANLR